MGIWTSAPQYSQQHTFLNAAAMLEVRLLGFWEGRRIELALLVLLFLVVCLLYRDTKFHVGYHDTLLRSPKAHLHYIPG